MTTFIPTSEFWKSVYPDGMTDENINNELSDLEFLIDNISKVYCHVTGNMASKPMIYADVINALFDDHCTDMYNMAVEEIVQIINEKNAFPNVRTTWDHDQMQHIKEEIVKEIKLQLGLAK